MISYPTLVRRGITAAVMVFGALIVLAFRNDWHAGIPIPKLLMEVWQNLLAGFVVPHAILSTERTFRWLAYVLFDLFICVVLSSYEVAQLWIPNREFDINDIYATFIGGVFALGTGYVIFRFSGRPDEHVV
jgi:VanZ family protein